MPDSQNSPQHAAPSPGHRQTVLTRRLEFLQLSDADVQRLRQSIHSFRERADQFVETFYNHLLSFDETAKFLTDPEMVARLKQYQREHLFSMLQADWDEAYAEQRRRIGRTHAERGVEPVWFLGAYNLFVQECIDRFAEEALGEDESPSLDRLRSLLKAIFLDVGLTLDEYFLQSTKDLRRALDMYFQANNELRQFAHFTSHDLKTPLGTVANLCEEVLDEFGGQIPGEAREMIESARRTTFRMSATIDELLTTAISPDARRSDSEASVEQPLQEAVERIRPLVDRKQIQLTLPGKFPAVIGNPIQLREVFYNLLSNAAKYLDQPRGQIEVLVETGDSHVTVCVRDNGPGIPHEEQTRIFAPFRRLAVHRGVSGSGLGLYFTNYLVEQQGGRLWVESEPGEGSTFFVQLKRPGNAR